MARTDWSFSKDTSLLVLHSLDCCPKFRVSSTLVVSAFICVISWSEQYKRCHAPYGHEFGSSSSTVHLRPSFDCSILLDILPRSSSGVAAIASLALWGLAISLAPSYALLPLIDSSRMCSWPCESGWESPLPTALPMPRLLSVSSHLVKTLRASLLRPISGALLTSAIRSNDYGQSRSKGLAGITGCSTSVSVLNIIESSHGLMKLILSTTAHM